MATDVDVQFFSHLNGLVLDNNWGDLIRLLDTCLVSGKPLPAITSTEINEQGDVIVNLFADHKCLLFQVVELSGFDPVSLNQKYRIKGIPNNTQLILKPQNSIVEKNVIIKGNAKLAALGYEIVFRDNNDIKRVYRAKNPTAQHPFIRVDESLSDGVNSYDASYAKSAMVGLLEKMDHIDDYQNPDVLQLPFDPSDPAKNWKIRGVNENVIRGWSRWFFAESANYVTSFLVENNPPADGYRCFTLIGDADCFYLNRSSTPSGFDKILFGCGLYQSSLPTEVVPNWFLAAFTRLNTTQDWVSFPNGIQVQGSHPLMYSDVASSVLVTCFDETNKLIASKWANPLLPTYNSGQEDLYKNTLAAIEIPLADQDQYLRGNLKHVLFSGKALGFIHTSPNISDNSMYVFDSVAAFRSVAGLGFYLGELE